MFISCCIVGWACLPKKKKKSYKIWVEWEHVNWAYLVLINDEEERYLYLQINTM